MTEDQRMVNVIREYIATLPDPASSWPNIEFDRMSYTRWAADEILIYVLANPNLSVYHAVEDMKASFEVYMTMQDMFKYEINFIFEIAYETAEDILDILSAMM